MKKYFAQLRPLERRLVVGVAVVLFIVLNWVFIWPHFSDWSDLSSRQGRRGPEVETLPDGGGANAGAAEAGEKL